MFDFFLFVLLFQVHVLQILFQNATADRNLMKDENSCEQSESNMKSDSNMNSSTRTLQCKKVTRE